MKSLALLILISVSLPLGAFPKEKLACTQKELKGQDCRLKSGSYDIRILPKTIVWNDGTWHTVDDMPLNGESVQWEKIQFQFLSGWPILQLWLWEKGFSETEVQSLHWYSADAEKRKFTILAEGIVRKRRFEPEKKKYLYDAWDPHSLKAAKKGELEWKLKSAKKIISKVPFQPPVTPAKPAG